MSIAVDHEQSRQTEDRSWTFTLLDQVRTPSTPETDREKAVKTLAHLEDYRSIAPLTALVEDDQLLEPIRRGASDALQGFDDTTTPNLRRVWWGSGDPVLMTHALGLMERSEADFVTAVAGDDRHPLQSLALRSMAFGFDEPAFQPVKVRALDHPEANVREAAADVLVWDEPVGAEEPLLRALLDSSTDVAAAAVDTLQYYPSRRVLRAVAGSLDANDERVRSKAVESFDFVQGSFEHIATEGDPAAVKLLREWMEPVRDLLAWSEEIHQPRRTGSPPARRLTTELSEGKLLELLNDPDGLWAAKKATLRTVAWDAYEPDERARLARVLTDHPDPVVREIASTALAVWSKAGALLALTNDPSFAVRKSSIYHLGLLPRDPALAEPAWSYMTSTAGTTAYEALQTYVTHADPEAAKRRLADLAGTDCREAVVTRAISALAGIGAGPELTSLLPLLDRPPGVSWAVHIELLDGVRKLGLPLPPLDDLAAVDNLHLARSVVALRCRR